MQKHSFDTKAAYLLNEELIEEQFSLNATETKELSALYDSHVTACKAGELTKGQILSKDDGVIVLDISYKSYGNIPNYEFTKPELDALKVGDELEVLVDRLEDPNGCVVLSYQKAKSMKAWDRIVDLAKEDKPVTGVVLNKVKGGLSVDIGIPAFLPGSQVDIQRVGDFDQFIGQEVTCKIIKINKKRGNVIISRRRFLEEERQVHRSKILTTIEEGQVLQGVAKNITNYGVFVDVGGVDGLLHITDISWGRVNHPSEMVKIGDTLTVKVIGLDKENEKISLGMKQLSENPWNGCEEKYPLNSKVTGRISSIADYGLFVEVAQGIEGLVHISEVSWTERITNLSKYYQVGQEIEVLIVAVDKDNRRMSLSIKQLSQDPWIVIANKYNVGDTIQGKVSNITDFGIFVELEEGVDGLVHVSDISWTDHITHPSERYTKGEPVEAVILSLDTESRKISLGVKQLSKDPWLDAQNDFPIGNVVEGAVSKLTNFGAFVRLSNGIEGLIHMSELPEKEDAAKLKEGDVVEAKVIKVNPSERKLGLSIKALTEPEGARAAKPAKARTSKAKSAPIPAAKPMKSVLAQALEDHAARNEQKDEE